MGIAKNGIASGSVRDLPPSKRFRHVGSGLGSTPSVLLPAKKRLLPPPQPPEEAAVAICLPVKKRAIATPGVEVADAPFCLPAKKRTIRAPPPEDAVPACLPAKKRAAAAEDAAPACLPAKKRTYAAPADAAVPACVPAKKSPCAPPPAAAGAVASACVSAKKRVHAPAPRGGAAGSVPASLPPNRRACPAPPVDTVASACVSSKKRADSPARRETRSAPVCLPVNKRVMPPFVPPPSVQANGARVVAAKEGDPRPQGSSKHGGGGINSRVASGTEERASVKELKKPEKPINHNRIKEEVSLKPRSPPREGKGLEKPCKVVDGEQSEVVMVEVRKKSDEASDPKGASPKEEPRNAADEVAAQEQEQEPVEDDDGVLCAVCASTDGDPSDPIVFCDGCDLMVHASCYGNPLAQAIPDGDWFCSLCIAKKTKPAVRRRSCCLCPASGGAMKRTTEGKWAHISCALFVPEVFFWDPDGRDGIDCSRVPAHRFAKDCYICEGNKGCALECSQPKCGLGFHVSCGLGAGLCIEYQEGKGGAIVAGFCSEHTELWEKQQLTGKYKIVARGQE